MLPAESTDRKDRAFSLGGRTLAHDCLDPLYGGLVPAHAGRFHRAGWHVVHRPRGYDSHQLMLVHEGRGEVSSASRKFSARAGDVFLVDGRVGHRYRSDANDPWTVSWLHFAGPGADAFLSYLGREGDPSLVHPSPGAFRALGRHQRIIESRMGSGDGSRLLDLCATLRLALNVLAKELGAGPRRGRWEAVHALMAERLQANVSLAELAHSAGMGIDSFRKEFRKETGKAPLDYFLDLKAQAAARDLALGHRVGVIARRLGFEDSHYFSRFLAKRLGRSAREWKKETSG